MPLNVEIVTAERLVYSREGVDEVVAPGAQGEFALLPEHAAFITTLVPGELRILAGGDEEAMAITGGFLEIRDDRVVVLADAAERLDEIDIARAEASRERAQALLREPRDLSDLVRAEMELRQAMARLKVVERRGRRQRTTQPPTS